MPRWRLISEPPSSYRAARDAIDPQVRGRGIKLSPELGWNITGICFHQYREQTFDFYTGQHLNSDNLSTHIKTGSRGFGIKLGHLQRNCINFAKKLFTLKWASTEPRQITFSVFTHPSTSVTPVTQDHYYSIRNLKAYSFTKLIPGRRSI